MIEKILGDKFEKYFDFLNKKMIEEQLEKRGIKNKRVLEAFRKIKRHLFLPEALNSRAYDDYAMEITPGQTISQPYIAALMTELMELKGGEKVLEIGTGSGWQTAILAELAEEVFSVDIKKELHNFAYHNLFNTLKFSNISLKTADGREGWQEKAPFDRIILTCGTEKVPEKLFAQLKEDGILLAPVGADEWQNLTTYRKKNGQTEAKEGVAVRFVKMA